MADKVEYYSQMAQFETVNITQTYRNWSGFLATAARFYKYPYDAQLMIYYQRPEATAVAPYDTWNIQMRRYIKRGSKGIAVLDNSGDAPKVQYLFDIADTGTRYNSRSLNQWKLLQEHEAVLQSYLEEAYGIEREVGMLENQLEVLAMDLANRYWEDNSSQLIDILAGTHISEYDSFTQGANFRKVLSNSILYQLISRCFGNADEFLGEEDFEEVPDFDTPKAASALGTAVSTLSSQVLREIERAVRSYDRQKENERSNESYDRTDLYPNRGLSVPEHPSEGHRTEAPDQVRQDAQSVSTGVQPDPVQPAGAGRAAVPAPVGDSGNRTEPDRADDSPDGEGSRSDGSSESIRPDEVGGADELPESTGGGDRDEGAYLQLGFMMPSEAEQIQNIETQAESVQPSAFAIDDTEINRALKSGSGYSDGKLRIAAAFATIGESKERADFLEKEYGTGGRSWDFLDGSRGFVDYDSKGILIKSWEHKLTVKLKWPEVETRIGKLVESGGYLTAPEKERFAALEEEYAGRGGIPTPNSAFVYPPAQVEEFHSDNPRVDAMMNFAAQVAAENDYAEPQRFTMVDTADGHFQIRDSIHDGIYTEPDGTQRVFEDEESADQYMQEITEEAQQQSSEDWLALERAKLPPQALLSDAEFAQQYLIPGETQLEMEGRQFLIDRVNLESKTVNLQDITFVQNVGFPIFRTEPISYVRRFVDVDKPDVLTQVKQLIDDFCQREYEAAADFSNLKSVGIGYTDLTDAEIPIEISVNLIDFQLERRIDGRQYELRQYSSLEELVTQELINLDFSELTYISDEDLERFMAEKESPSFSTGGFAEYPAVENNLPYDIVIETLHIDEPQQAKPFIDHYYVVNDLDNSELEISEYKTLNEALNAYQQIPADRMKSLGVQNTNRLPGSLDFIQCVYDANLHRHRDVLITDYLRVPGWDNSEVDTIVQSVEQYLDSQKIIISAQNFHITDFNLGEGGAKAKFRMNMDAIHLLKELEQTDRNAVPEEQEVLSRYVGWGGLADAFDDSKSAWAAEFAELSAALTPEEYSAARASTLNAHYTSPTVIKAIYDAVGLMGFQSGNILEPAMGIGNFFGMLPELMQDSKLYGVELDSITGRIAQKLYPNAEITVAGFETTDRRDFYDLAIGNVPFGNYKVSDKPYDKLGFSIHNYFFAKALDQVRPGGVVAFVTSRYTMDSKSADARKYLAQRAELLGAIRLPNDTFKANAGTEVVSDIIFLQKRDHPIDIEPDWVHLGQSPEGFAINSYFVEHPEMVMGTLAEESTQYGMDFTVQPLPDADLGEQLHEAVLNIRGIYQPVEMTVEDAAEAGKFIPADPNVKNFSYTVVDGDVYFRENSIMRQVELNDTAKGRIKGMAALREIVNELIEYQMEDYPDEDIASKQRELNAAYDDFTKKYGLVNDKANSRVFSEDSSYYLLCSLENLDEDQKLKSKADMFTKRTIRPERKVVSVDTPSEALAISIGERGNVDLPFMAQLMGTPGEYDRITSELKGVIFLDPMTASEADETKGWQTADEYLSGNVRDKLRIAQLSAKSDSRFSINVEALQKAQPKDLEASEIDVRLGATWVDRDYIEQFMHETFDTPWYAQHSIQVKYSEFTAEWRITNKSNLSRNDVAAYVTYGTERANAYRILEETLNLKDIRIYDTIEDVDGKEKRVLNKKETTLAQQKQQAIKDAFQDWIWKDPERREHLVWKYNELFNSSRPREYDGSHIRFGGMNPDINLREHQRNAIAHVLYGGNTLLAHEVGAGKTFEMAASAMELKRLGLCQKSLFVVPNHLTLQWASEFIRLYPSAKLLVANRKDFETANRKKFCARIATGDYDAVIIGHSQFEKIPISAERQERLLQEQIDEITNAIEEMKLSNGERFSIKQMEKTRKSLEARLDKLTSDERKDDVITFEQLGVDRLFVDESHAYKNLFLYTKMRNVAGLSTSEAQKSSDMFMKCRYMDELTGGRGVIFATGTPVSNSMTELYTVMRYLQYSTLQQKKLTHFDCWASTFGETTTAIELAPEGTGYRARTRFAKFFNLPELMNMFKEVADIKTSDLLHLPVPEAKFETVVVEPSEIQAEMVHHLSERAAAVHSGVVDASQDNMLCITSDGKKIGLDQRLMNPELPDDPNSKLNSCVGNVFRIWEETKEKKLTQLLFCDMSTPKGDGSFNVYDDIRSKLIAQGVPEIEIAFIHSADTEAKKQELFRKVRTGQVRVLLGSTQKMGAGTNVQDLLVAVHHLDIGWRPADLTQRNGRIIRQGNQNKEVQVYNYVTNGTFDAYCWQTLENKQKFISQIMTSKSPVRSCDDVDEQALSYAEIKALCAGNPLIKEKMDLDIEVARLKVLKADHQSQQYRLEDKLLKYFPGEIEKQKGFITGFKKDIETAAAHPQRTDDFCGIEIMGKHYTEKADAGEAILSMVKLTQSNEPVTVGSYRGFAVELYFDAFFNQINMNLHGEIRHRVSLGSDARGNLLRMDNVLSGIPERLQHAEIQLTNLENQREAAKAELGKPFPQAEELAAKSARLAELDAQLNMEDRTPEHEQEEPASMMDNLKRKSGEIQPPKRGSRNHEEER